MGCGKEIAMPCQTPASHNLKGQKSLVCSNILFVPIKRVFAVLCKPHCSVTQCQPVSETCLGDSDNHRFQQHKRYTHASGLPKVTRVELFSKLHLYYQLNTDDLI